MTVDDTASYIMRFPSSTVGVTGVMVMLTMKEGRKYNKYCFTFYRYFHQIKRKESVRIISEISLSTVHSKPNFKMLISNMRHHLDQRYLANVFTIVSTAKVGNPPARETILSRP